MLKKIKIKQALQIWESEHDKKGIKFKSHPSSSFLKKMPTGMKMPEADQLFEHLIQMEMGSNLEL